MGLVAGIGSLAGGLMGMFGGSNQVPQNPAMPAYQYAGMPTADVGAQQLIAGQAAYAPQAQQATNYLYNNYGIPGLTQGGNVAGAMGQQAGLAQLGAGYGMMGQGAGVLPYAQQALQSGFDPQGQVYNTLFQQNTDQTRALEAARGILTTPYGAGVEAQSNVDFNTAWQQQLQQRQAMGAQTAGGLLGQYGGLTQQGIGDITAAPGTFYGGAAMPYQTAQTIGMNQLGAIGAGQGATQQPISNYLQYLQGGTGATQASTNQYLASLAAQNQQFQQQQAYGKAIGQGLGGIGTAYSKGIGNTAIGGLFS